MVVPQPSLRADQAAFADLEEVRSGFAWIQTPTLAHDGLAQPQALLE